MKKSLTFLAALLTITASVLGFSPVVRAAKLDPCAQAGDNSSSVCSDFRSGSDTTMGNFWSNVISTMLMVIGILAVAVIIYGGLTYVTSAGKSDQVTRAKNIIIYAVVALVVSVSAYAIVKFVLDKL